jgi:hypothetical protein
MGSFGFWSSIFAWQYDLFTCAGQYGYQSGLTTTSILGTRAIGTRQKNKLCFITLTLTIIGAWQGVVMDYPKFHPDPPCPTLLRPAGGPLLKRS